MTTKTEDKTKDNYQEALDIYPNLGIRDIIDKFGIIDRDTLIKISDRNKKYVDRETLRLMESGKIQEHQEGQNAFFISTNPNLKNRVFNIWFDISIEDMELAFAVGKLLNSGSRLKKIKGKPSQKAIAEKIYQSFVKPYEFILKEPKESRPKMIRMLKGHGFRKGKDGNWERPF